MKAESPPPPLREQLVRLLADGEFHSGELLARELGVSRTAVWKSLRGLSEYGLELHAVPKRGYRLGHAVQMLDGAAIERLIPAASRKRLRRVETLLRTTSTNTHLLEVQDLPAGKADVCLAEYQSAGRGRRGRSWIAPFGSALCLSMSWLFPEAPRQLSALSLAVGVCVLRALRSLGAKGVALKWPNDLLVERRKLGGILIELRAESAGPAYVVAGLGLNLQLPAAARRAIVSSGVEPAELSAILPSAAAGRNAVAAAIIEQLVIGFAEFERSGFAAFAAEWRAADALAGVAVRVLLGEHAHPGLARGIDEDGALLLETAAGRLLRFVSGEISLRAATRA